MERYPLVVGLTTLCFIIAATPVTDASPSTVSISGSITTQMNLKDGSECQSNVNYCWEAYWRPNVVRAFASGASGFTAYAVLDGAAATNSCHIHSLKRECENNEMATVPNYFSMEIDPGESRCFGGSATLVEDNTGNIVASTTMAPACLVGPS